MLTRIQLLLTSSLISSSRFHFAMKNRSPTSFNKQSATGLVFSLCHCPTVNSIFSSRLFPNARSSFKVMTHSMRRESSALKAHSVLWPRLLTTTLTTILSVRMTWPVFYQKCLSLLSKTSRWPVIASWSNNSWTMVLTFTTQRFSMPQNKHSNVSETTMATRRSWRHNLRSCWPSCNCESQISV